MPGRPGQEPAIRERATQVSGALGVIYQVRALAEIGTDAAGRILERQLHRRLSDDQLEQAWYWIDLAASLRVLNRQESLPHLLRCSETARESPLGHYYAAETVCILGFASYLRQPATPLGQAALRDGQPLRQRTGRIVVLAMPGLVVSNYALAFPHRGSLIRSPFHTGAR